MRSSWRERFTTALLVVAVAVPVGVVIGGGLDFGGPDEAVLDASAATATSTSSTSTTTSSTVPPTTTTTAAGRPANEVRVLFANGSRTAGAAVTVGRRLEALGYVVLAPAPSPADPLDTTAVFHREGFEAEAAAVARDLGLGAVAPAPFPPVPDVRGSDIADVVVIVADDALAAAGPGPAG
jgi:hypothetical protein